MSGWSEFAMPFDAGEHGRAIHQRLHDIGAAAAASGDAIRHLSRAAGLPTPREQQVARFLAAQADTDRQMKEMIAPYGAIDSLMLGVVHEVSFFNYDDGTASIKGREFTVVEYIPGPERDYRRLRGGFGTPYKAAKAQEEILAWLKEHPHWDSSQRIGHHDSGPR